MPRKAAMRLRKFTRRWPRPGAASVVDPMTPRQGLVARGSPWYDALRFWGPGTTGSTSRRRETLAGAFGRPLFFCPVPDVRRLVRIKRCGRERDPTGEDAEEARPDPARDD